MTTPDEKTAPLPGIEVAEIRDLKRWTTYFTPKQAVRGIWWCTLRELPGGARFELIVKDDTGAEAWRGRVEVAIDPPIESDDPGLPLIPEDEWESLSKRLPELRFVATEQIRLPPDFPREPR